MWYTYVLISLKDREFYTGCTNDLNNRLKKHKNGEVFSTKHRRPLKLIYYEVCFDKNDAFRREKYLKTGMGKKYIKNRIKRYLTSVNF